MPYVWLMKFGHKTVSIAFKEAKILIIPR